MKKSWRSLTLAVGFAAAVINFQPAQAAQLVLFEGSWCGVCQHWNKTIGVSYSANEVGRKAPLRRVEIGGALPPELSRPNVGKVYGVPTFVVMDRGREVGRIEGYTSEKYFWQKLDDILTKAK